MLITVYSMTVMSRVYIPVSYTHFSSILRRDVLLTRAYIVPNLIGIWYFIFMLDS